ncbi:CCA tRNA nucleotidyltransferase [Planococcus salinus]|uniref:CCA tRNA nucleotidyltransferase n=1 Tax=Planococcus salinus TaxID=1848460 RepID=A0A3M8P9V0_9BACL|nr:CCA tRNA nucleotidyltransferase [Planococcus salinus]RNF40485.1 CCA tRNA nucleotidyltransferase [Planococcus salinus]
MKTALKVIGILEKAGYEAYMVGGAVRDYLLGKSPQDIDVTTSASPQEVKSCFSKTIDTGIQHGTVLVLLDGEGIEVTTFRTESGYSDNRRPDAVEFVKSLPEDLKRRDFTINAMAMTKELKVIDFFGGQEDLKRKLIRAVGEPDRRFSEDALRMLRAVRFSSQLNFMIDEKTLASIKRQARLIRSIAVERIKTEIDKIMVNPHTQRSMEYLKTTTLTKHLPAGYLFEVPWEKYIAEGNSVKGWVYMLYHLEKEFADIRAYKFSNDEKRLIEGALRAARADFWDAWTYYVYTEEQLQIASALREMTVNIPLEKRRLPIHSKTDIQATGRDLMDWSASRQGPWLKKWIEKMEKEIVYGRLQNDKEQIKDWFINEYNHDA